LIHYFTEHYHAASYASDAEPAVGQPDGGQPLSRRELRELEEIRRREALAPPRLTCYPRLLNEVQALAGAGQRDDVVRILTQVEDWMFRGQALPGEIPSLLGPAGAGVWGGVDVGDYSEEDDVLEVTPPTPPGVSANDAAANLVDMEAWALDPDPVVVGEVKAEPSSGGVPRAVHVKEEGEEEGEMAAAVGPGDIACNVIECRLSQDTRV
jgi:hypothetical protein